MENTDHGGGGGIPGDVLIQILVWLPVISLLRFKSVCKSWRDLIESSFFIHLHAAAAATLTTSCSSSNKFGTFILQTSPRCDTDTRILMLTPPPPSSSRRRGGGGGGGEVFEVEDLGVPPLYKSGGPTSRHQWKMVGSCNGLIFTEDVCLWNPATRQFRILPESYPLTLEERVKSDVRNVFGFGFDVKTKDYKVVQIRALYQHDEKLVDVRVQVYSLSTNSWRWLDLEKQGGINSLSPKSVQGSSSSSSSFNFERSFRVGLYLNGSIFFKVASYGIRDRSWILSFDFTKEIFTPIMFPDELVDSKSTLSLTYFGADKIALLVESSSESRQERRIRIYYVYEIWVLNTNNEHDHDQEKQEEQKESYYWTKLQHSIRISTPYGGCIYPIAISDDGEFALIETSDLVVLSDDWKFLADGDLKLLLFNLVTKEEKLVFVFPTGSELQRADIYMPNLVSVIGGGGNGNGTASSS